MRTTTCILHEYFQLVGIGVKKSTAAVLDANHGILRNRVTAALEELHRYEVLSREKDWSCGLYLWALTGKDNRVRIVSEVKDGIRRRR
jgi:hypothetical protein